jgi:hypothetical protein
LRWLLASVSIIFHGREPRLEGREGPRLLGLEPRDDRVGSISHRRCQCVIVSNCSRLLGARVCLIELTRTY